jgi:tRNA threonylcarbamoyladenosine biosynthesis protein TsaE
MASESSLAPSPFNSGSVQDTKQHARNVAPQFPAGSVIRLQGTLGAGKTSWVQGLVEALHSTAEVTSPSFALLHEYRGGRLDVFHWDLYRLPEQTDWSQLDLPDHLPSQGLTLIEWSERYPGPWPTQNLWDLRFDITSPNSRLLTLSPVFPAPL